MYKIINGDNLEVLKTYPDNHFDSIVTDPPYGISFLGKGWDEHTGLVETYKECLRVLKPGGHLLAFSAARTYHRLATSIEDAGFEVRDQIMWIYSSGFPKSQDVGRQIQKKIGVEKTVPSSIGKKEGDTRAPEGGESSYSGKQTVCTSPEAKQWSGWGTQLKPAHEPIVMARKPLKQTIAKNCLEYGTGAINIDDTRIPFEDAEDEKEHTENCELLSQYTKMYDKDGGKEIYETMSQTRKKPSGGANGANRLTFGSEPIKNEPGEMYEPSNKGRFPSNVIGEIQEPYQKYFYCPKVNRKERHLGFDTEKIPTGSSGEPYGENGASYSSLKFRREEGGTENGSNGVQVLHKRDPQEFKGNNHPTVKPIKLMDYLIRLVTPKGGKVLDPFSGSGSTGCAAVKAGYDYTGIELDAKYCEISEKRINACIKGETVFDELFETE